MRRDSTHFIIYKHFLFDLQSIFQGHAVNVLKRKKKKENVSLWKPLISGINQYKMY